MDLISKTHRQSSISNRLGRQGGQEGAYLQHQSELWASQSDAGSHGPGPVAGSNGPLCSQNCTYCHQLRICFPHGHGPALYHDRPRTAWVLVITICCSSYCRTLSIRFAQEWMRTGDSNANVLGRGKRADNSCSLHMAL